MRRPRHDLAVPAALAVATTLLHVLTAADGFGIFRDELYYVACSEHLGFGYVDHTPLIGLVTWLARRLFGDSLVALRLFPALAGGATVLVTALMTRELGGDRFAQALAALATALAPVYVGNFGFLSMNAFDVLIWAVAAWVLIRLHGRDEPRLWPVFGLVAGLGLQNKLSVLFLGFGLVVGLLLARQWKHLASRWFWFAGVVAIVLFLPYPIWQVVHDWPTLEFMSNASRYKNLPLSPVTFLSAQVLMMNPVALPLFLSGLGFYLFASRGRPYRALGWAFVAIVLLMITQRSKAYYLSPSYTWMFAPGAVLLGQIAVREGWRWLRPVSLAAVALSGLVLAPLAKPLLPVEQHVAYAAWLGVGPSTSERKEVGRLSQFFADRLGWPELAAVVADVYHDLPIEERERACIFGQNYGQAGAIDFYGAAHRLPRAISAHNSYYLWGPRDCSGEIVLVIGDDRDDLERIFARVEQAAEYTCADCMPYENHKPIWVCRDMRFPLEQLWPEIKNYN